jgi:hypothetical protein
MAKLLNNTCIIQRDFKETLENLDYPFVSKATNEISNEKKSNTANESAERAEQHEKLKLIAKRLLSIELPFALSGSNQKDIIVSLLVKPFEKRFKFHFCTDRKTNNLDKVKTQFHFNRFINMTKLFLV